MPKRYRPKADCLEKYRAVFITATPQALYAYYIKFFTLTNRIEADTNQLFKFIKSIDKK